MYFIIALILLIIIFLMILKIRIKTVYKHDEDNDLLQVKVYLFMIKVYTFSAPIIKVDGQGVTLKAKEENIGANNKKRMTITPRKLIRNYKRFQQYFQEIVHLSRIIKRFLSSVSIYEFNWRTVVGVGDAAHSAQVAGAAWAVKGSVVGLLSHFMRMRNHPQLFVEPKYEQVCSKVSFSCMISFRMGHAIVASIMLMKYWKGKPKWLRLGSTNEVV